MLTRYMASMFPRTSGFSSLISGIIFSSVAGVWVSPCDTMTTVWRHFLL